MTAEIINGREIASLIKNQINQQITQLKQQGKPLPHASTIIVGENKASELYLNLREKACKKVGIQTNHHRFSQDASSKEIMHTIDSINKDPATQAIMIQLPLPGHLNADEFYNELHPTKDVEGFSPHNLGITFTGQEHLVPCTPKAVLTILDYLPLNLQGAQICIINHSVVVGKPLTMLLLQRNATVSICHVYTKKLKEFTKQADIVISATGVIDLITPDLIKQDATVIDVGINPTKDGVQGDVAFEAVRKKARYLTPVPGGVGPVTIACCLQNIMKCYHLCMNTQ